MNRTECNGQPIGGTLNLLYMPERERTPFGDRLYKARTHAKLSQPKLAVAVGMSQSTLGELEWRGSGSGKTAQIAAACGVRPEWLASGQGPMLDQAQRLPPDVLEIANALAALPPKWRAWALKSIRPTVETAQEAAEMAPHETAAETGAIPQRNERVSGL